MGLNLDTADSLTLWHVGWIYCLAYNWTNICWINKWLKNFNWCSFFISCFFDTILLENNKATYSKNHRNVCVILFDSEVLLQRIFHRASLVAQWLRVCLPMQGTRVRALVREDPTCRGATGPVSHNYWACASGACAPQEERPRQWEARAPWWGVAPACHSWRKPSHRNEDPTQP